MTQSGPSFSGHSLEDVHRTVTIPPAHWWRRLLAFAGPAYMVSVGYMDPGNWATDLAGGASFGYQLLWVLLLSNAMAVLLQTLSARLGIVTGRDLAQACRDEYAPLARYILFGLCEIAIVACDLAEVLGTAIGLNLLFGLPLLWGVVITGFDVILLLAMQRAGIRKMEAFIISLILIVGLCFIFEIFLSKPSVGGVLSGFRPTPLSGQALYVAIGILGATVMPHNLYLHSALVQSRNVARSIGDVAQACRYNLIDSAVALNCAFFVNAAILIVSAAAFHFHDPRIAVDQLQQAHGLLKGVLGSQLAPVAFALALLCAGQSSTVTGTLAGQITMEGFLNFRMRPWLRRLITRLAAIVPAAGVIALTPTGKENEGIYRLLIFSQVVLSLQLSFAVVPLVKFTGSRRKMGPFASPSWVKLLAWLAAGIIMLLNAMLVYQSVLSAAEAAGRYAWLAAAPAGLLAAALVALLAYMIVKSDHPSDGAPILSADEVAAAAGGLERRFARIGVALEANANDSAVLAQAIALARTHRAELVLMHVVEGVGGQWYGPQTGDFESRHDETYISALAERLRGQLQEQGIPAVTGALGFGHVVRQLVKLVGREGVDLLILGSHGHRGLADVIHGTTINRVRHELSIPILAVRK